VHLGFNKFLIFCNWWNGNSSGSYPYPPGYFTLDMNGDYSSGTASPGTLLTSGYIAGSFIAYRSGNNWYFVWNDYALGGNNSRYLWVMWGTWADGSQASVKLWSKYFDSNVVGIANNSANDGQGINVIQPI
jgi:hypothetical protein